MKKIKKKRINNSFIAVLIAFAVISFWRGVWGLMDEYLFPNDRVLSLVSSIILGLAILILTEYKTKVLI